MGTGARYLHKYTIIPTQSGESQGMILIDAVSGGTPPYTVVVTKEGEPSFSSKSFNNYNLSEGVYQFLIVDALGGKNNTTNDLVLTAYTMPTYSAAVTTTACTTNSNKYCDITIYSAATNWESHEAILKEAYYYNLYKDGKTVRSMRVNSGDTSQTFSGLTNGDYFLQIVGAVPSTQYYDTGQNFADACCSGVNATYSANTFFSAITSAYTRNSYFSPSRFWPGWSWSPSVPNTQITGIYKNGIVTDREDMWFFTGNSTTGILNQLNWESSNPNSARTESNRLWYLGVTGQTMSPGEDKGPTGYTVGTGSNQQGGEDLSGGTITGDDYAGTFFYNPYIEKFQMWGLVSGASGYGWFTINPTHKNYNIDTLVGSKNAAGVSLPNPLSADNVSNIGTVAAARPGRGTFQYSGVGTQEYYSIKKWDSWNVATWRTIVTALNSDIVADTEGLYLAKNDTKPFGSATTQTMLSPCEYLDYTSEITYGNSGTTHNTSGIVLAAKTDDKGYYGPKGVTHMLTLEFYRTSGMTVYYNRGQDAYSFQRKLYGSTISTVRPTVDAPPYTDMLLDVNTEYVGLVKPKTPKSKWPFASGAKTDDLKYSPTSPPSSAYRQFESKVLGTNGPYAAEHPMASQGYIRIKVTRSGTLGEYFKIEATRTMGNNGEGELQDQASVGVGEPNPYNVDFQLQFSLLDSSTWSGDLYSAPGWVEGNELSKFLGGVKIGYISDSYSTCWFHPEFTGSCNTSDYVNDSDHGTGGRIVGSTSGVTLTDVDTNHVQTTKDTCNFDPKCTPKIPQIRPRMQAYLQTFKKPTTFVSGCSRNLDKLKDLKIYDLSGDTSAKFNFIFTGETSDMTLKRLYPQINIHRYDPQQKRFALVPDYKYLIDNLHTISGRTYDDYYGIMDYGLTSLDYSASTYIPFSALSTGTSYEYIVKPNFISKDKTTPDPVWVEINQNLDEVKFTPEDSYFVLTSPPPKPQLNIAGLDYDINPSCRLAQQNYTVTDVPSFDSNSAFTYSAITLNWEPTSKIIVTVNGVVLTQSPGNSFDGLSGGSQTGDFVIQEGRLYFSPKSVNNNDLVTLIYPAEKGRSFHNQSFTVESPTTGSGATIYQNGTYYFINLDYESLGNIVVVLNGATLQPTKDYVRVGDKLIQIINPTYNNLATTDTFNLYYLTQYLVVGNASVKTPQLVVQYDKTLNYVEELELDVRDMSGNTVQSLTKKMKLEDYGTKAFTFTIEVPYPGTYTYNVISKRDYPLLIGKTLTLTDTTRDIKFVMDSAVFYSPYNLPESVTGSSVTYY